MRSEDDAPQSDKRLIELMLEIRHGVIHLLAPEQRPTPSAEDQTLGLQTLKTLADASWRLAEKERFQAEMKVKLAIVQVLKAETEKIREQRK